MHESSRQELVRSQHQLESKLEQVFTGSKAELHTECEEHHTIVERSKNDLEEVSEWVVGELWCCR